MNSLHTSFLPSTDLAKTTNRTLPNMGDSSSSDNQNYHEAIHGINSATGKVFGGRKIRTYEGKRRFSSIRQSSHDGEYAPRDGKPNSFFYDRNIHCKNWNVVTTIFNPSDAVRRAAIVRNWCTVIVADTKTPSNYMEQLEIVVNTTNVVFLSVDEQLAWANEGTNNTSSAFGRLANAIPFRHFARKNIGYLFAIAHGAQLIFDFDDDNLLPLSSSLGDGQEAALPPLHDTGILKNSAMVVTGPKAFNHHSLMGISIGEDSWPRGFPISQIHNDATKGRIAVEGGHHRDLAIQKEVGVLQFVSDKSPDVDAIHRLVKGEEDKNTGAPIIFHRHVKNLPENIDPGKANYYYDKITELSTQGSLVVPSHTFVPYNAQASIHTYNAMFSLLLPSTVTGRVSDIWRSYFSQRLFRDIDTSGSNGDSGDGLKVVILPPDIVHERHEHSLLADLQAEDDLYSKTDVLLEFLSQWEPSNDLEQIGEDDIPSRMEQLWIDLYERDYIQLEDVTILQVWLSALAEIGYVFPKLQPPSRRRIKDVVLMGQFNFPNIAGVEKHNQQERNDAQRIETDLLFWYQKWRQRFDKVVLRGPFPKYVVDDFQTKHQIDVQHTKKKLRLDEGFVSPMDNLLSTLKQYEHDPKINGVLYVHDDMLVNTTNIFFGDGRREDLDRTRTVYATHDKPSSTSFRIHPASVSTTSVGNDTRATTELYYSMPDGFRSDNFTEFYEHLEYWEFNWLCMDRYTAVAKDPRSTLILEHDENDGGEPFLLVPTKYQSDFLYVPTSLTKKYEAIAQLLIDHEVFLECGFPKITDFLLGMPISSPMRQYSKGQTLDRNEMLDEKEEDDLLSSNPSSDVRLESVELCTSWDYNFVRGTTRMITDCRSNTTTSALPAPYSVIHPFKLTLLGYMDWGRSFDWAIAGLSLDELSNNQ